MRVLVVLGRTDLDPGRSSWLRALSEIPGVEIWRAPAGSPLRRAVSTFAGVARGVLTAPGVTMRTAFGAVGSPRMRTAVRTLAVLARRADVLYFPRPQDASGFLPAMRSRPSVVTVPPGEAGRGQAGISEVLGSAKVVHYVFDVDRREADPDGRYADRSLLARAGFDPAVHPTRRPGPPGKPLRALIACGFWPNAGIDDALDAVRETIDRGVDVRLEVVGDGVERERVVHAVHELGLTASVTVRDPLLAHELIGAIGHADVLIHPHLMGALGWPALSALASGIPVVAVDSGSASEVIGGDGHGFLIPYGDVQALSEALTAISADAVAVSAAVDRGRTRMQDLFGKEDQSLAFTSVLRAALDR